MFTTFVLIRRYRINDIYVIYNRIRCVHAVTLRKYIQNYLASTRKKNTQNMYSLLSTTELQMLGRDLTSRATETRCSSDCVIAPSDRRLHCASIKEQEVFKAHVILYFS